MAEGILKFQLPEEREEFELAQKAVSFMVAIEEIRNEVFRPARKHGYPEEKINQLMERLGGDANELVGLLEEKFTEILQDNGVFDV